MIDLLKVLTRYGRLFLTFFDFPGKNNLVRWSNHQMTHTHTQPEEPHEWPTEYEGMMCCCWHTETYRDSILRLLRHEISFTWLQTKSEKKTHPFLPTGSVVMRARRSGMGVCWHCTSWEGKKWQDMCNRKVLRSCWSTLLERFWNFDEFCKPSL